MLKKWWRNLKIHYYLEMMKLCNAKAIKSKSMNDMFNWLSRMYYYSDKAVFLCKEEES